MHGGSTCLLQLDKPSIAAQHDLLRHNTYTLNLFHTMHKGHVAVDALHGNQHSGNARDISYCRQQMPPSLTSLATAIQF
jgi:hypothetical protein